jgi:hypothetical protein
MSSAWVWRGGADVLLDRSQIAVAERSWPDNLDLALHVLRRYGAPLAGCALATIVPIAIVNHLLLYATTPDWNSDDVGPGMFYLITILIMIEAPLATAPMTLYLGAALFEEHPRPGTIARGFLSCLPQMLLLQVIIRTLFIVPVVTWIVPYGLWPYLSEVILLERNPLVSRGGRLSTLRRNSQLHRGHSGDYLTRGLASIGLGVMLIVAVFWTEATLASTVFGFEDTYTVWLVEVQAAFWLVIAYFTVVRFLSYLDQRIRAEGWEVELLLRAERGRLENQMA